MSGQREDGGGTRHSPTTEGVQSRQQVTDASGSYVELATSSATKLFAKFSAVVGAGVGVGLGVMLLALKYVGSPNVTESSAGESTDPEVVSAVFVNSVTWDVIALLPLLAAAIAAALGLYAARELAVDNREAVVAGAAGGLVGAVALVVVGASLGSMAFGTVHVDGSQAVSKPGTLEFGNLVKNAAAVGVGAGVVGAVVSWANRTYS